MPAVRAAPRWFEVDVRTNASGALVIMHDATVDRTTNGRGFVSDMTTEQVRALRLTDGSRVPFAADVLRHLRDNPKKHAMLHVKDSAGARLLSLVGRFGVTSQVTIWSLRRAELDMAVGYAKTAALLVAAYDPYNFTQYDAIVVRRGAVTRGHVDVSHAAGLRYWTYTANLPAQWERLTSAGVDRILTDRPTAFRAWCAKAQR